MSPGDLNVTTDFRDEIVKNRLDNSNLAAVFSNDTNFKFRNLTTPLTAINVLPMRRELAMRSVAAGQMAGGVWWVEAVATGMKGRRVSLRGAHLRLGLGILKHYASRRRTSSWPAPRAA